MGRCLVLVLVAFVSEVAIFQNASSQQISTFRWNVGIHRKIDVSVADKSRFHIEWTVRNDGHVGAEPELIVEAPPGIIPSLGNPPSCSHCPSTLLLTFTDVGSTCTYCTAPIAQSFKPGALATAVATTTIASAYGQAAISTASNSWRCSSQSPLTLILLVFGLVLQIRAGLLVDRIYLAVLFIFVIIFTSVAAGQSSPSCGCVIRLTLVLPPEQWGKVNECLGPCRPAVRPKVRHFRWREPCDISAALGILGAAATNCSYAPTSSTCASAPSIGNCDLDGWCYVLHPGSQCSIPSHLATTCLHDDLRGRLQANASSNTAMFLAKIFDCKVLAPKIAAGRPYTTEEGSLVAQGRWSRETCPWSASLKQGVVAGEDSRKPPSDWTRAEAAKAAQEWSYHGLEEHASIASFSRFSLELMRFAAPPSLLEAAHAAAIDEVRHARLAFNLAAQFRGQVDENSFKLEAFPISTVNLSSSLSILASRTLDEGCVGESRATAQLVFAIGSARAGSPAHPVMLELRKDEARHAALAWATLHWTLSKGAFVPTPTRRLSWEQTSSVHEPAPSSLSWGGRIPKQILQELEHWVDELWVHPWHQALSKGVPLPRVDAHGVALGAAIEEAAQLVQESFDTLVDKFQVV